LHPVGTGYDVIASMKRGKLGPQAVDERSVGGPVVHQNVIVAAFLDAEVHATDAIALQHEVARGLSPEPGSIEVQPDCLAGLAAFQKDEFEHASHLYAKGINNTAR
jgi:hypothetical protein